MSSHLTEATRYLCSSVHLSASLRNKILTSLLDNKHRAIAVSPGVDLVAILLHCLYARQRKLLRDLALAAIFVILAFAYYADALPYREVLMSGAILAGYIVVTNERWTTKFSIVAGQLGKGNLIGQEDILSQSRYAPNASEEEAIEYIKAAQKGNVRIYSGFSPFIGAGFEIGGWSFALNIEKGKKDLGVDMIPGHLDIKELYAHINGAINALNIKGIETEDAIYVNGQRIRQNQTFLSSPLNRPASRIASDLLEHFIVHPMPDMRHYRCYRVLSWEGELALSIFLRLTKTGQCLFSEVSYFLLTPIDSKLKTVDTLLAEPTMRQSVSFLFETLVVTPFYLVWAPLAIGYRVLTLFSGGQQEREIVKRIEESPLFDYGAGQSIRVQHCSKSYDSYFQKLDKEMYFKLIERTVLDAMIGFLDERNIDTSDLRERQTSILNNGVIVTGGAVQTQSMVVGQGAKSVLQGAKNLVQR